MKIFPGLFSKSPRVIKLGDDKATPKKIVKTVSIESYKQDLLIKTGREQFKKLLEKGLQLPIAVL